MGSRSNAWPCAPVPHTETKYAQELPRRAALSNNHSRRFEASRTALRVDTSCRAEAMGRNKQAAQG
jgi:hypothetical protein